MTSLHIQELASMFGISPKTVHSYTRHGLLHAPAKRGAMTRYDASHVERVRAIRHLFHVERRSWSDVKAMLSKMSPAAIREIGAPPREAEPAPPIAFGRAPTWTRLTLLPGLELHLESGASPVVQRIAEEIEAKYKAKAREEA